jgi:hypothetical protein
MTIPTNQLRSLSKGKMVIFKPEHHGGEMSLHLGAMKYKKLMKAKSKNKGVKLALDPKEIEYNTGKGLFSTLRKIAKTQIVKDIIAHPTTKKYAKKAMDKLEPIVEKGIEKVLEKPLGKKTASKVAKIVTTKSRALATKKASEFVPPMEEPAPSDDIAEGGKIDLKKIAKTISKGYKKYVKPVASPLIRKGLEKGVQAGAKALSAFVPEASPLIQYTADKYGDKGVDFIMSKTGLGMLKPGDDSSTFLSNRHPAMKPGLPMPDHSLPRFTRKDTYGGSFLPSGFHYGGSFMMAGERRYRSGGATGFPLDPLLPQRDFSMMY